jgi:hypothetical protein
MVDKGSVTPSSLSERASMVRGTYDQVTRGGRAWGTDGTGRVLRALKKLLGRVRPKKDPFDTPTFDGTTDVDYFLRQFTDVSRANKWSSQDELIHLRGALQGEATIYGQAKTVADVSMALRNQFSISPMEARRQLLGLERQPDETVLQYADTIDRLVRLGHDHLTRDHQVLLGVETLVSTLRNPELQRHLLAVRPSTLSEAVQASRDYEVVGSQVSGPGRPTQEAVGSQASGPGRPTRQTNLVKLKICLLKLTKQILRLTETLKNSPPQSRGRKPKAQKSRRAKASGNGGGPPQ